MKVIAAPRSLTGPELAAAAKELVRLFTASEVARVCGTGAGNVGRWVHGNVTPRADSSQRLEIWHHAMTILRENHPDDGLVNWFYLGADDVKIEWEFRRSPLGLLSEYETEFVGPVIIRGATVARDRYQRLGRTPHHVAERFAAGEITREQLVQQLGCWNYLQEGAPPEWDIIPGALPSSFATVTAAHAENLIDDSVLREVLEIVQEERPRPAFVDVIHPAPQASNEEQLPAPNDPPADDLALLFLSLIAEGVSDHPELLPHQEPGQLGQVRSSRARLIPDEALSLAQEVAAARGISFTATAQAVGAALSDRELIATDAAGNRQVGRRLGGRVRRVWELPADALGLPQQAD